MFRFKVILLLSLILSVCPIMSQAQLKKSGSIERVKGFTNGSVSLMKSTTERGDVYSLTLRNNSKFHDDVNLLLGDKETAVKNLKDFSETLKTAKSGEHFDFEVMGLTYTFSYGSTLGKKCFKIWAPNSVSSDYGRLFKATIDDIIKYFSNNGE